VTDSSCVCLPCHLRPFVARPLPPTCVAKSSRVTDSSHDPQGS